jgi:cell pole-organizing protein PopZ
MEDILASIRRILSEDEQTAEEAMKGTAKAAETDVVPLEASMIVEEPGKGAERAPPVPAPAPVAAPAGLVAPATAAAVATTVGGLVRTLIAEREQVGVSRSGPTIEDLVREEIRPLLKEWLDANLQPLVERLVRAEIERVVGRAVG